MSGRRIRTLTYKAMEIYEQTVLDMDKSYRRALDSLVALFDTDFQQINISKLEQELSVKHEDFECIYKQYSEYLSKTNSKDSLDKLQKLSASHTQCIRDLTIFKDKVTEVKQSYDLRVFSPSKPSSMRSSSSAKARAALARLQYAEKEAELRKQQSRLEERQAVNAAALEREQRDLKTELELLSEQRIVAEIQAEENDDNISCSSHIPNEPQRQIDTFLKDTITHVEDPVEKPVPIHNDLTRLFLRKELLISRITYFDDKTENFQAWKNTFESVCNEIGVSPVEELDLLVKWLGSESRKFATSIRSAYSHDVAIGLQRVWERLNEQYGAIEKVHQSVLGKLDKFPPISPKEPSKLYELSDVLSEIEALKTNAKYSPALSYFDTSVGVAPIVNRLPRNIQEKWISTASHYKTVHDLMYPPFSEFVVFVRKQARIRNDPSFASSANDSNHVVFVRDTKSASQNGYRKPRISTSKTEIQPPCYDTASKIECSLHKTTLHSLENCRTFISKTFAEKRRLLKDNKLCFKCFGVDHVSKDCNKNIVCGKCDKAHNTVMHIDTNRLHGGERTFENTTNATNQVNNKCTQICGKQGFSGKSCAKIVLVDTYAKGCESNKIRAYAIIDDQSNRSLVSPQLLDSLKLDSQMVEYSVTSCNGVRVTSGRMASGLMIESLNGDVDFEMSSVFECDAIPNNRQEIPTPEVAAHYAHLQDLREDIPVLDRSAGIQILIGRDLIEAHHVHEQKISSTRNMPYAQKLALGWVIVGETCLGNLNSEDLPSLNVNKTLIVNEGRNSILSLCTNSFRLEEQYRPFSESCPDTESDIFKREKQDERPGLSREDREFNQLMEESFVKGPSGNWTAPLPFKSNRKKLPSNKGLAVRRAQLLDTSLKKNPTKKQHFVDFMENILEKGHAEEAPPLLPGEEHWYLPIFGVYHPKKVDQIRVVFDSSAKYEGVSLNDLLLSGPDLTNNLLGVLLRFRKEAIAVTADIQQMFYCFNVHESHRNFLRFLWYKDNDTTKNLTEYRMKVHVFGNKPSPSVASYGLRKTAEISTEEFGQEVTNYILNNFYVDDGLTSVPTEEQAIELIKNTQSALSKNGNLRLHKIASNSVQVLDALPREDLAKNLSDLDLSHGDITDVPLQRSLGLCWNIKADAFTFRVSEEEKPFTRRGVLSTINSIYDPVGFVAPVVIVGKLLLRDLMASSQDWDDPLPLDQFTVWQQWCCSLKKLNQLEIPRAYLYSVKRVARKDLHVYCDASEKAIAAVAYIVGESTAGTKHSSFVMGKIKVAPVNGHTIPRLELCAAVLASQVANTVLTHIDIDFDEVKYFSDSKVVLGYISNTTRRFYTYVSNRVQKILTNSLADQWNYVPTHINPADIGTRGVSAEDLPASLWLNGSSWKQHQERTDFPLVAPDVDSEIRVNVLATTVSTESALDSSHFEKFSEWKSLKSAITCLQHVAESYHTKQCKGWHVGCNTNSQKAEAFILKTVQKEAFSEEYANLKIGKPVSKSSSIASLNAFIDEKDVMRVGGRLEKSNLTFAEKHPVIVPRKCHIGTLLVRHYHSSVKHQGRHFTEGALRSNGYWIVSGKRLIASVIHQCVKCKKLRGPHTHQLMADLPSDRLSPAPPFTYVGVDCFGPWNVVTRKTRGGQANSKRWAVLFTCLTIRAIHIEVIEEMSGSAFINALRRFIARFGNVQIIRSDRGTNFVGAASELKIETVNVEDGLVKDLLRKKNIQWVFNPPHAPHMGGVWERLIGVVKRILNSILSEASYKNLTHDVLSTLMAEVTAIVNARPIVPVSTDGSAPEILSPSTILTQKWDFTSHQFEHLSFADSYRVAWKNVQFLANRFWHRWRFEYLQLLQPRRKWNVEQRNIREGDVVLVKDSDVVRNQWPYGIVEKVFASEDGKVRKLSVRIQRDGQTTTLTRPITEVVLLVGNE